MRWRHCAAGRLRYAGGVFRDADVGAARAASEAGSVAQRGRLLRSTVGAGAIDGGQRIAEAAKPIVDSGQRQYRHAA